MRQINRIIVHHSATADSRTLSWGAIRHHHRFAAGADDIGYHAGCEFIRSTYECLFGRPVWMPGAHTRGYNSDSLGFCFVGNYDQRIPARAMLDRAARLVLAPWCDRFDLTVDDIRPHREFSSKSCPGTRFDMGILRDLTAAHLEAIR